MTVEAQGTNAWVLLNMESNKQTRRHTTHTRKLGVFRETQRDACTMDRLPLLKAMTSELLAAEYVAYKKWSRRRGQRYVCPLKDYLKSILLPLGISHASVDACVRAQESSA